MLSGCSALVAPAFGPDPEPLIRIGIQLPTPLREAALLAIAQEKAAKYPELGRCGWKRWCCPGDDPGLAPAAFERAADDPNLLAVIGPPTSEAARAEMPVASNAQLALLSPNLTEPLPDAASHLLRLGGADATPSEGATREQAGAAMFFRLPATRDREGTAAADYAFSTLGKQAAVAVVDGTTGGQTQAQGFQTRFASAGGVATVVELDARHPDTQRVVDAVRQVGSHRGLLRGG